MSKKQYQDIVCKYCNEFQMDSCKEKIKKVHKNKEKLKITKCENYNRKCKRSK